MSARDLKALFDELTPDEKVTLASKLLRAREGDPSAHARAQLVAYVVLRERVATREISDWLAQRLPDFMLPSHVIEVAEFPTTPNGKVDRQALPNPFGAKIEAGDDTGYVAPRNDSERALAKIWGDVLGLELVGIHDNFFEIGGDSILSIQVVARARKAGFTLAPAHMFEHQTVAQLAAHIGPPKDARMDDGRAAQNVPAIVSTDAPLTPIQSWFFEQAFAEPHHWNQAVMWASRNVDAVALERALLKVVAAHDALRLRFARRDGVWQQRVSAEPTVKFVRLDLREMDSVSQTSSIRVHTNDLHASLSFESGPTIACAHIALDNERQLILLIAHHLCVDALSWAVIRDDLATALREPDAPAPQRPSFVDWAHELAAMARRAELMSDLDWWRAHLRAPAPTLPLDVHGENNEASSASVSIELDEADTRTLLRDAPARCDLKMNEALIAALFRAVAGWTGEARQVIGIESHGRDAANSELDLVRAVGWFTNFFPAPLEVKSNQRALDVALAIRDQLRDIPRRGLGYGLLRYGSGNSNVREELASLAQPSVLFNYLGQTDRTDDVLFAPADEFVGDMHSPRARRHHIFEVTANIAAGKAQIAWQYSQNLHARETVERLAQMMRDALREFAREVADAGATEKFADAGLDDAALGQLLAELNQP